jgi:hypothetical protein
MLVRPKTMPRRCTRRGHKQPHTGRTGMNFHDKLTEMFKTIWYYLHLLTYGNSNGLPFDYLKDKDERAQNDIRK